jgi:anti-sigma-K factor RskA
MATDHEYWRGQSEIYALGALDGEELDEFQAHLAAGCPLCDATVRETGESLALLPASLEPLTPPPALRGRILEQIDRGKVTPISAAKTIGSPRRQRIIGTIAAGIIGVLLGGGYYYLRYEPRHTLYTSVINLLRDPSTRDYPLYGAGPTPTAKGRFLWNESGEGHIFVSSLPAPPEGKMYAVWTIAQNSPPRYVGTVTTDATGQGGLHITAPRGDKPVEVFAVTLEPAGTTAAPTGPMVLVSKQS